MIDIITNEKYSEQFRDWVSNELGKDKIGGEMFAAIGFIENGKLLGAAIYHEYRMHMIEISLASISPRWCTKTTLKAIFSYPFETAKVARLNVTCAKKNKKIRKLVEKLGFIEEGCGRQAYDGKEDAIIYGMLKTECRWI